jgi:hypothetical protein
MRYLTNEQRRRRTLFKPTLWAVASWVRASFTPFLITALPKQGTASAAEVEERERVPPCGREDLSHAHYDRDAPLLATQDKVRKANAGRA